SKRIVPMVGLDLVAESDKWLAAKSITPDGNAASNSDEQGPLRYLGQYESVWLTENLGHKTGESVALLLNDRTLTFTVRGVFKGHTTHPAPLMDTAAAQPALQRPDPADRVLISVPPSANFDEAQSRIRAALPEGIKVRPTGTGTDENRKMLAAFRWN